MNRVPFIKSMPLPTISASELLALALTLAVSHHKMNPKGCTELIIGVCGAKHCAEDHVIFCFFIAPQKPNENREHNVTLGPIIFRGGRRAYFFFWGGQRADFFGPIPLNSFFRRAQRAEKFPKKFPKKSGKFL